MGVRSWEYSFLIFIYLILYVSNICISFNMILIEGKGGGYNFVIFIYLILYVSNIYISFNIILMSNIIFNIVFIDKVNIFIIR